MIRRAGWHLIALVVALALALAGSARAIDPGVAKGALSVDDARVLLSHAYAWRFDDADGFGNGPELRLLLADREVPVTLLAGHSLDRLERLARTGRLNGVLLRLDPAAPDKRLFGTILYPPADPDDPLMFFEVADRAAMQGFSARYNRVTGASRIAIAGETGAKVAYDAAFDAPLFGDEPAAERVSGAAAAVSPQGRAVLAYMEAVRAGDLAAARPFVSAERLEELEALRARLGDAAFRAEAQENIPDPAMAAAAMTEVIVRGDRATVRIDDGEVLRVESVVRRGSGWVVD